MLFLSKTRNTLCRYVVKFIIYLYLCACIINRIEISILFFKIDLFKDRVLFVRMYKNTGYCLSACENLWGTICPHVQIDGVLFVRMCKNDGVLFVRGTICP